MLKPLVFAFALATTCLGGVAVAQSPDIGEIVDRHILPSFQSLATDSATLAQVALKDCTPDSPALRNAYNAAFDDWVRVSHLRFGPTEKDDRAFALAFWPDSRGATPKALAGLIAAEDPVVNDPTSFAAVSIAARGFYGLEYLLYDAEFMQMGTAAYRCALVRAIAKDTARIAQAILTDWQDHQADLLRSAGSNDIYRSQAEALQELFKALVTGLEFTSDTRLGRPLGTYDHPRPNRAEARRAGRSLAHVVLSLESTQDLARLLSGNDPEIDSMFDRALLLADRLDDPDLSGVADPQGRLRAEALQQQIDTLRAKLSTELGPRLGVAAGFNSLDGD